MHKLVLADQIVYCREGDTAAKTILGSETIGIPATLGGKLSRQRVSTYLSITERLFIKCARLCKCGQM